MQIHAFAVALLVALPAFAQYTGTAGHNAPTMDRVEASVRDDTGAERKVWVERPVEKGQYGNAKNAQHDLAVDGAFDGQTVAVIQLYNGTDLGVPFDFEKPKAALRQKGFSVYRWRTMPTPEDLEAKLKKASQLWIIGGVGAQVDKRHL